MLSSCFSDASKASIVPSGFSFPNLNSIVSILFFIIVLFKYFPFGATLLADINLFNCLFLLIFVRYPGVVAVSITA